LSYEEEFFNPKFSLVVEV